jgi:hypothetical protein
MNRANNEINVLQKIYLAFSNMPTLLRDRVCEECSYSVPTFYRKLRSIDQYDGEGRGTSALSNAEKAKIFEMAEEVKEKLSKSLTSILGNK